MKKYTRGNVSLLSMHIERRAKNHSNEDIIVKRSYLNYSLLDDNKTMMKRLNERLENVYCMNRQDVKVCSSWIVTLPKDYKKLTIEEQRKFFKATYDFFNKDFGKENVIAAEVHNDEKTPHIHYAFVPVVQDKKRGLKVSAKEFYTRDYFRTFHDRLDNYLKEHVDFYEGGVLNDSTEINIEDMNEYKNFREEMKNKKKETLTKVLKETKAEIKAEEKVLYQNLDDKKLEVQRLEDALYWGVSRKKSQTRMDEIALDEKLKTKEEEIKNAEDDLDRKFKIKKKEIEDAANDLDAELKSKKQEIQDAEDDLDRKFKIKKKEIEDATNDLDAELKSKKQEIQDAKQQLQDDFTVQQNVLNQLLLQIGQRQKQKEELEKEIKLVDKIDDEKQKELDKLKSLKNDVSEVIEFDEYTLKVLDSIESRAVYTKKQKVFGVDIVKLEVEDYEILVDGYKGFVNTRADVVELQQKIDADNKELDEAFFLKTEYQKLKSEYDSMQSQVTRSGIDNHDLKNKLMLRNSENERLRNQVKEVHDFISDFKLDNHFVNWRSSKLSNSRETDGPSR